MSSMQKAAGVLSIIMEELNMPKGSTMGDVALALSIIDPSDEIINLLKPLIRNAAIERIKEVTA